MATPKRIMRRTAEFFPPKGKVRTVGGQTRPRTNSTTSKQAVSRQAGLRPVGRLRGSAMKERGK